MRDQENGTLLRDEIDYQRDEVIMSQGALSFPYRLEMSDRAMMGLAGVPAHPKFGQVVSLSFAVSKRMG